MSFDTHFIISFDSLTLKLTYIFPRAQESNNWNSMKVTGMHPRQLVSLGSITCSLRINRRHPREIPNWKENK